MPNRKKPNTLFLPARIKRLMQKDEEVGKLSATVPVIAARALEQFLEELITKTASITMSLQAKTLTPEHIRQNIYADPRLSFLHDLANRMAPGPNNNSGRSLTTSSTMSTASNRTPFQQQLSVPYQDPPPLPSTTSTNQSNSLYINHQLSRSYSTSYYTKVKSNKRSFDLVNDEQEDDDDDDDESFMPNHTAT
ncbi:unnamed protein product [Rotaria magnacalcarata]|uniref:Transcription factor CBF/NF-Y/archaeal histone domain-containing protein n=3 Tax=Rotaria magnacalcarata TaxID=392030 RepID=A0A816TZ11_9BILA|nr:unnamed protein product [Rotaria magnacalcarata]CAF1964958.1 unnamed protein product [Rotaria magnacalcarata]CAF2101352.1 unnamed protein product [Rotaria magnacalcarata]CAF3805674.1 unnamed protein product [Rotaria magnacalcarata]CAF3935336.1 unnamed protein product [Rotaria magnacalcarata]